MSRPSPIFQQEPQLLAKELPDDFCLVSQYSRLSARASQLETMLLFHRSVWTYTNPKSIIGYTKRRFHNESRKD